MSPRKRPPENRGLHELMERYVDGDPSAFSRLHERLQPRLRGLLLTMVRDESTVEDLIQLTLLKGHLARDRFALQGGDPDGAVRAWYFAIARNVALDHLRHEYRSQRRRAEDEGDVVEALPDAGPDPEQLGERVEHEEEIVRRVRAALAALPPGQREVVELHKLRGMSMADIASRLEVREGAVRVRAHRAYKTLARLLSPSDLTVVMLLVGGTPHARPVTPRPAAGPWPPPVAVDAPSPPPFARALDAGREPPSSA
ncbi:RNA polymerase sigma factor [Paraliomyxa miuraensis]|uniref:RNA polymerase sigma factor n=1 Tax=Paraliomyxa miuraensis TaxID=376150 RepID=UPI00225BA810|nr:RNA polymerase sigma factor [Paraliomyxa miuraensis]MCX4244633.1 RNA polymerase sigma factor [Paraliomyxa miuraensis]